MKSTEESWPSRGKHRASVKEQWNTQPITSGGSGSKTSSTNEKNSSTVAKLNLGIGSCTILNQTKTVVVRTSRLIVD